MKKYLFIMMSAMLMTISAGCSNDEDEIEDFSYDCVDTSEDHDCNQNVQSDLYKTWQLIGYGSEDKFHMIAEEYRKKSDTYGYRFYLIFNPDGTFNGRESFNEIWGYYTCKENEIKIETIISQQVYHVPGYDDSRAFLSRLLSSTSYDIKYGKLLRIYYSDTKFLYFESIEME